LDLQIHVQSVPITTKVASSNPSHGEVYSIKQYVIKFVGDLRQEWYFICLQQILVMQILSLEEPEKKVCTL
jgi:hypothetical protein